MRKLLVVIILLAVSTAAPLAYASDHADPFPFIGDGPPRDALITDLFFYPKGDQYILMFNIFRALNTAPPYNLTPYEYSIYIDLHTTPAFENPLDLVRYGGTIANPEEISPDVSIKLRLNNDTSINWKEIKGLKNSDDIKIYTGVRDDPFVFPRFEKKNVVAMVFSIPKSSFPDGQQNFLLWGTSAKKNGKQIDHVGRSLRTQLPRLAFLNTVPVEKQAQKVKDTMKDPGFILGFIMRKFQPLLGLRWFDAVPDVMIYNTSRPVGYPNGRVLEDDVTKLTCDAGDCLLLEIAFTDVMVYPRRTTNDKPFLDEFPYLAEPWPSK
jgi:hypothetical protein